MKKSTIWILAIIMSVALFGLLYLQINYLRTSIQLRSDQFDEAVDRSLYQIGRNLELTQTTKYLDEAFVETTKKQASFNKKIAASSQLEGEVVTQKQKYTLSAPDGTELLVEYHESVHTKPAKPVFQSPSKKSGNNAISNASFDMQEEQKKRYLYERRNIDDVITKILNTAGTIPIEERIDFKLLESQIRNELKHNGIELPFQYEITDKNDKSIYKQAHFTDEKKGAMYSQVLFPNDAPDKLTHIKVYFPSLKDYFFSEVVFLVPAIMFTLIVLVVFILIIYITFRQKRLSEMKSDFMNNMTHEFKTPVSTISLASQMLKDSSLTKSPAMLKHISDIINDETVRLSFQVEKVLQMSLFEKQQDTLKMEELDANDIVAHVANTFELKVQKFGGNIDIDLEAIDSTIQGDKMHITNLLFNLLDNALKYRKEDVPLQLMIRTWNNNSKLYISVEDNGIGIKKEDVKKIFDRFYRVSTGNRHDVKGFGLGLAYVKKVVQDHKGTIKAVSNVGKDTKFIISLPLF